MVFCWHCVCGGVRTHPVPKAKVDRETLLGVVHLSGALVGAALEAVRLGGVVVCATDADPVPLPEVALQLPLLASQGRLAALARVVALVASVAGPVSELLLGFFFLGLFGLFGLSR